MNKIEACIRFRQIRACNSWNKRLQVISVKFNFAIMSNILMHVQVSSAVQLPSQLQVEVTFLKVFPWLSVSRNPGGHTYNSSVEADMTLPSAYSSAYCDSSRICYLLVDPICASALTSSIVSDFDPKAKSQSASLWQVQQSTSCKHMSPYVASSNTTSVVVENSGCCNVTDQTDGLEDFSAWPC